MSPLALATAALLAVAAAQRPAHSPGNRPFPRDVSLPNNLYKIPNCKTIHIESRNVANIDPLQKLTVKVSKSHFPSTQGPLVDITDYCSMIVKPTGLGPARYILDSEEVKACSSKGDVNLSALADHIFSPVTAVCNYRQSMCEPIDVTITQTCVMGIL